MVKPQFFVGIALAAIGGCLVSLYKPNTAPAAKPQAAATSPSPVLRN